MAQAKAAAGGQNLMVRGTYTTQPVSMVLEVDVLDELQFHLIPVLFGRGLRPFDLLS